MPELDRNDFASMAAAAEKAGGFAPDLARTRPAARRLVHSLLSPKRPTRLAKNASVQRTTAVPGASDGDGALLEWLGGVAAGILGPNGVVAAIAGGTASGGAALSPLGALAAAVGAELCKGGKGTYATSGKPAGGPVVGKCAAAAPDAYAELHFRSATDAPAKRWEAELQIPTAEDAATIAVHFVCPRRASGTFRFCGIALAISDGRGTFPIAAFRAGLSRGGVSFARAGASPVPGAPFWKVDEI